MFEGARTCGHRQYSRVFSLCPDQGFFPRMIGDNVFPLSFMGITKKRPAGKHTGSDETRSVLGFDPSRSSLVNTAQMSPVYVVVSLLDRTIGSRVMWKLPYAAKEL